MAPEEKERLFIIKLRQCSLVFDFADATSDLKGKELKLLVLKDCIDYVVSRKVAPFGERVYPEVFNMVRRLFWVSLWTIVCANGVWPLCPSYSLPLMCYAVCRRP